MTITHAFPCPDLGDGLLDGDSLAPLLADAPEGYSCHGAMLISALPQLLAQFSPIWLAVGNRDKRLLNELSDDVTFGPPTVEGFTRMFYRQVPIIPLPHLAAAMRGRAWMFCARGILLITDIG